MKAINVLRGFLSESPSAVYPDEVLGFVDAIERELKECYIELPKDMNGVPLHVGDKMVELYEKAPYRIANMTLNIHGWYVRKDGGIACDYDNSYHYKPPTVEDVLREFALKCEDAGYAGPEVETIASDFAERLQLKERDDG